MTTIPELARRNRASVFHTLHTHGPLSRREIVRLCGLTEPTVFRITRELLEAGLVRSEGKSRSTGGRRSDILAVDADARQLIGVDVNDRGIQGLVVNLNAQVIVRVSRPVQALGNEPIFAQLCQVIQDLLVAEGVTSERIAGLGVAIPGLVDHVTGQVFDAENLRLTDLPLKERLQAEFDVPIEVENDANVAALGEHRFGAGRGVANMVYVAISAGIGAGIILNGELYRGDHAGAGELGLMVVGVGEQPGEGQNFGILEDTGSGRAIIRYARRRIAAGERTSLLSLVGGDFNRLSVLTICAAATDGDPLAQEVIAQATTYAGIGIANLVNLLDLSLVVLGGTAVGEKGISIEQIRQAAKQFIYPPYLPSVRIQRSELGEENVAIGAASMILDKWVV
ncbi:MAG TPA: ROK family transcriptional regulator [Anaerolineae bacterium]|nr:ROK family transcriptional regulator [Anaerolineae bacterium]HIQ04600.1 ROK family transcriptional regulator [Anaerolineae bacterium]